MNTSPALGAGRAPRVNALHALSPRERDVLAALAGGFSNGGIARRLYLSERTVECHLHAILFKLDLAPHPETNRRVLAAASWLRAQTPG